MTESIKLPVWSEGKLKGYEVIEVDVISEGRYALTFTPGLAEGVAAGDVVEIAGGFPGVSVVERGGNFGVLLWSQSRVSESHPAVAEARELAIELSGRVDGGTSRSIVLTIPAATGFKRIVDAIDRWVAQRPEFAWEFSNAYDAGDGETPLAWCRELMENGS